MILDEVGALLKVLAAYDGRNVGEADVVVWGRQLAEVEFADAIEAVHQHYGETREWARPSDIRQLAQRFYNRRNRRPEVVAPGCVEPDPAERRRLGHAEAGPLALPSRGETDEERDARNVAGAAKVRREIIAPLIAKMSMPPQWKSIPGAPGAWWEDEDEREAHATALLAEAGRLTIEEES